jgi:hypothetical protein
MKVYDVEIQEYIDTHNRDEHNYLCADDTTYGKYDICLECDCKRYVGSNEWIVDE